MGGVDDVLGMWEVCFWQQQVGSAVSLIHTLGLC